MIYRNPYFLLFVYDMQRALGFYKAVFEVSPTMESGGWSTLDFGSFELALHITGPNDKEAAMPHAGLNLEVDHIETVQAVIEQHGGKLTSLREATDHVPVRVATFVDTEGNGFELRQQAT